MSEEAGGDLFPSPVLRLCCSDSKKGGRKRALLSPLPRTYCLPGLGQKAAVLFLQALGQTLQVFQLFFHRLSKLQSLLGASEGRARRAPRARKTETQRQIHSEGQKQLWGTETKFLPKIGGTGQT